MKHACLTSAIALSLVFCAASCRNLAPPLSPDELKNVLMSDVASALEGGRTNDAIALLADAAEKPEFAGMRGEMLSMELRYRALSQPVQEVIARYAAVASGSFDLAERGYQVVEAALADRADGREAAAIWAEALVSRPLPPSIRAAAYGRVLETAYAARSAGLLAAHLAGAISSLPEQYSARLAEREAGRLASDPAPGLFDAVAGLLDGVGAEKRVFGAIASAARVRRSLALSGPAAGADDYKARFDALGEHTSGAFQDVVAAAGTNTVLFADVCRFTMRKTGAADGLFKQAARRWLDLSRNAKDAAGLLATLAEARALGMSPEDAAVQLERAFYDIMPSASAADRQAVLDAGEGLFAAVSNEGAKKSLGFMLLDGCALSEDYTRALGILARGVPMMDERQARMLLAKAKAHDALKRGEKREAIGHFRTFMADIDLDESFIDPLSMESVSAVYLKAMNAARVAGLWDELGDAEEATAARREALEGYTAAIESTGKNSRLRQKISAEIARLGTEPGLDNAAVPESDVAE